MRAVECMVQGCGHIHAGTDGQLVHEVLTHAREVHPDLGLSPSKVERFVEREAYEDLEHGGTRKSWSDVGGWHGTGNHS
jgi:hypothetical protein